ncbi:MAG: GatB/YqeY domain-containing protein [Candidatus Omnitrophota bacterium]|nr:GatB/YqeY domain-containing protein [Candidatus Omnitrophota bacterium]
MIGKRIDNDIKEAMRNKDSIKLTTLRMLKAAIKNVMIQKKASLLEDADVFQIIARQIKQHKDSIESFSKGQREDLADKERQELKVLQSYLPKQLSDQEITAIVKQAIVETNAQGRPDMGKVMKLVLEKTRGRSDAKLISEIVVKELEA